MAALRAPVPVRIWIDVGKREPAPLRQCVRSAQELLVDRGWRQHRNATKATLRHTEVGRGAHDEASWGRRFDRVLKFLFPRRKRIGGRRKVASATASPVGSLAGRGSVPRP